MYALTTKTPNYYLQDSLIFLFPFFTQRLIPSKNYIPLDLDRIYIIPLNLL